MKRLYKSSQNKMVSGVCGGVAEYFNFDPSIIRILWAIWCLFAGMGLVAYIIAAIILPKEEDL
jgi:phage shock protein PspC (stress-responsive transcriptional regulator)